MSSSPLSSFGTPQSTPSSPTEDRPARHADLSMAAEYPLSDIRHAGHPQNRLEDVQEDLRALRSRIAALTQQLQEKEQLLERREEDTMEATEEAQPYQQKASALEDDAAVAQDQMSELEEELEELEEDLEEELEEDLDENVDEDLYEETEASSEMRLDEDKGEHAGGEEVDQDKEGEKPMVAKGPPTVGARRYLRKRPAGELSGPYKLSPPFQLNFWTTSTRPSDDEVDDGA